MENGKNGKVKNIFFIGTFVVLLISNIFQFLGVFANTTEWKTKTDMKLENFEYRLEKSEAAIIYSNHLLLEIRYNLRAHILHNDEIYIENAR